MIRTKCSRLSALQGMLFTRPIHQFASIAASTGNCIIPVGCNGGIRAWWAAIKVFTSLERLPSGHFADVIVD